MSIPIQQGLVFGIYPGGSTGRDTGLLSGPRPMIRTS
jgi:hypothetical protein